MIPVKITICDEESVVRATACDTRAASDKLAVREEIARAERQYVDEVRKIEIRLADDIERYHRDLQRANEKLVRRLVTEQARSKQHETV